jgi:tetratricopeptide (TPR) repeat protein
VEAAGIKWKLVTPQKIKTQDGEIGILRIQDIMVYNIINWVNWKRPLYFAVTVARENMSGLDDYLSMEGMVYRIGQTRARPGEIQVNTPVLDENVFKKYKYRGLTDPNNYLPPNTIHLVTNYFIGFAQLAERYAALRDTTNALRAVRGAIERTPSDLSKRLLLYQVLVGGAMYREVKDYLNKEMEKPEWTLSDVNDRLQAYALLDKAGERQRAYTLVETEQKKASTDTSGSEIWQQYIINLYSIGDLQGTLAAIDRILQINPGDKTMQESRAAVLQQIQATMSRDSLQAGRGSK